MNNPMTRCHAGEGVQERRGGGGVAVLFSVCFIYIRPAVFLPDSHLLFSPDTITGAEARLPITDTDMTIISSAEACGISTGGTALINYQSLHYTFDDRVKFSAEKFHSAGGQLIPVWAKEKRAKRKPQESLRGGNERIDLCHRFS